MTGDLFSELLGPAGTPPTWRELADAVWLAAHLTPPQGDAADDALPEDPNRPFAKPSVVSPDEAVAPDVDSRPTEPGSAADGARVDSAPRRTLALPGRTGDTVEGTPVRVPSAPALPGTLALRRALRPLGRRAPRHVRAPMELDEEATVDAAAQTGFGLPVLRPAPTRWLDVALIVDDSVSMRVWDRAVKEFRAVLETAGTFRSVQEWTLLSEDARARGLVLRRGASASATSIDRSPAELVDPTGRRIVLVVSDCISPVWSDGTAAQLLRLWGRGGPVAVVQPLPRRLWGRTRIDVRDVKLRAFAAGTANSRLVATSRRDDAEPVVGLPVPLLTLDPRSLGPWASLTSGESQEFHSLVMLVNDPSPIDVPPFEGAPQGRTPAELVADFKAQASPAAVKLAVYLSAVPLSLPVMLLVQEKMLSEPRSFHLSEVMLSGLLSRTDPAGDERGDERADEVAHERGDDIRFEFRPGVREELMGGLSHQAARRMIKLTTDHLATRHGSVLDFRALLQGDEQTVARLGEHRAFAEVTAAVLRRLGFQRTVTRRLEVEPARTPPQPLGDAPLILGTPPPRPRELFGREKLLHQVQEALASDDGGPLVLVAPEGGGASAVALEYVHSHGGDFDCVLWLSAASPTIRGVHLERLREAMLRPRVQGREPSWLLVVDGAVSADQLPEAPAGRGRVLVTSSASDWPDTFTVHRVAKPSRGMAIRIARGHAPSLVPSQARRLAERLDDSPLALEIATALLSVTGESPDTYLERLAPDDDQPLSSVCRIALDHVARETPQARDVLHRLAVLAPGSLPARLLSGGDFREGARPTDSVLAALVRFGLVRNAVPDDHLVFVHPTVQRACLDRMTQDDQAVARRAVRTRLVEYYGTDQPDVPALWRRFDAFTRHLDPVGALGDKDAHVRDLVLRHIRYLHSCGDLPGCQALGTLALRRLTELAGAEHPGVATLAGTLEAIGVQEAPQPQTDGADEAHSLDTATGDRLGAAPQAPDAP